jgi:hypothetical protein
VPLWLSFPLVGALWLSSWISLLDSTGNRDEAWLVWSATIVASALLAARLRRSLAARLRRS